MREIINEFRHGNGRGHVDWYEDEMKNCELHSVAMASRGELYHAEPCYRRDWGEAIACSSIRGNWDDTMRFIIWDLLGKSEGHRQVLLNNRYLAYGYVTANNMIFLTVRGK